MKKIIFISLYNVRNQIAAAYLQKLAGQKFEVYSAWVISNEYGSLIIDVMKEIGVDIIQYKSKKFSELTQADYFFDCVITLCDDSNIEKCPIIPMTKKRIYWEIESPLPDVFEGRLEKVRKIRDKIKSRIEHWLKEFD